MKMILANDTNGGVHLDGAVIAKLVELLRTRRGRKMFTLTKVGYGSPAGTERQFRCWSGIFYQSRSEHFDSMGENLIFTILGEEKEITQVLSYFLTPKHRMWKSDAGTLWTP